MSLGPVMLDIDGLSLSPADRELLREPAVGGLILFSRNYESPHQLTDLVDEVRALRDLAPDAILLLSNSFGAALRALFWPRLRIVAKRRPITSAVAIKPNVKHASNETIVSGHPASTRAKSARPAIRGGTQLSTRTLKSI